MANTITFISNEEKYIYDTASFHEKRFKAILAEKFPELRPAEWENFESWNFQEVEGKIAYIKGDLHVHCFKEDEPEVDYVVHYPSMHINKKPIWAGYHDKTMAVSIHEYADGSKSAFLHDYYSDGYHGRLIDTRYSDGTCDTTDWCVFVGSKRACEEYMSRI